MCRSLAERCSSTQIDFLAFSFRTSPTVYSNSILQLMKEVKKMTTDLGQDMNGIFQVEFIKKCFRTEVLKMLDKPFRPSSACNTGMEGCIQSSFQMNFHCLFK